MCHESVCVQTRKEKRVVRTSIILPLSVSLSVYMLWKSRSQLGFICRTSLLIPAASSVERGMRSIWVVSYPYYNMAHTEFRKLEWIVLFLFCKNHFLNHFLTRRLKRGEKIYATSCLSLYLNVKNDLLLVQRCFSVCSLLQKCPTLCSLLIHVLELPTKTTVCGCRSLNSST